ncbi:hypothetical protein [Microbispora bryophytorum]|uniref:hypothetical protein n=1 Tax=Microbispora bryophytorum TaxID=1460882 RepID=UPI00340A4681
MSTPHPDDPGRPTPLHAAVAILTRRWRDLTCDVHNHGRRLGRDDDRLRALETRLMQLENHVRTLRNELKTQRGDHTNAELTKVAHLGL